MVNDPADWVSDHFVINFVVDFHKTIDNSCGLAIIFVSIPQEQTVF
jgi:hypothetical protein